MTLDVICLQLVARSRTMLASTNMAFVCFAIFLSVHLLPVGIGPSTARAHENFAVFGLQFSPDGKFLAATSNSLDPPGPIVLWNTSDWSIAAIHRPDVGCLDLDFSTDGKLLAYGTKKGKVGVINVPSGSLQLEWEAHSGAVYSVAFMPDGKSLFSAGSDHKIHQWNKNAGELMGSFEGHTDKVDGIAVSPDGLTLVSGGIDEKVRVWNIASRKVMKTFQPSNGIVRRVSFTNDGAHFWVSRWDGNVRIRNTATGKLRARLGSGSNCADITNDNRLVATAGHGSTAHVYEVQLRAPTDEERAEISTLISAFDRESYDSRENAANRIIDIGMIAVPQLREAITSKNAEVRVRARTLLQQVLSPQPKAELPGHTGRVEVVDFSPDGKLLATACRGGDIKVWDGDNFQELITLRIPSADEEQR